MLVLQKDKDIKVSKAFACENSERYGNFVYDAEGRAILSELGSTTNTVGQERIELDFQ